ncbi:hypothetical protein [Parasphingopyxis lamellibrachiae]|uniref:DUF7847 domain-containing protein n=1 Tax=Parasphingopyxis lamellibrachiae TaxID=680125 RepID=A0A3D9FHG3_9SPHN|nr:hypothetical protein [Parasphingopyxis lamellibrachiae]RED16526.1 hypothetical protein DFR46_1550 [Parasphingopyxis lamellibrachiae]
MATLPSENPRFSFGATVNDMFSAIGRNFLLMTGLALIFAGVPNAVYSVVTLNAMEGLFGVASPDIRQILTDWRLLLGGGWLVVTLCGVFAQTAISWVALRGPDEASPSIGDAVGAALRHFFPVLGIMLIYYLAIFLIAGLPAMALFGLAGVSFTEGFSNPDGLVAASLSIMLVTLFVIFPLLLFLMVVWIAAIPAAIQEHLGPIRALGRSWALTSGHRWKLLAMVIIFSIVVMMVSGTLSAATMPMMAFDMSGGGNPFSCMMLATVLQSLLGSLTLVVTYPALTATYMNLRIAREGLLRENVGDIFD